MADSAPWHDNLTLMFILSYITMDSVITFLLLIYLLRQATLFFFNLYVLQAEKAKLYRPKYKNKNKQYFHK